MLLHFPSPAGTSHTEILQGSSKTTDLMPFEMAQVDEIICIDDISSKVKELKMMALIMTCNFVPALDPIGYDNRGSQDVGIKTMSGCLEAVGDRVTTFSNIKGVRVCQVGLGS
jgi:hypothetical protein